jgi:hypothetical protein
LGEEFARLEQPLALQEVLLSSQRVPEQPLRQESLRGGESLTSSSEL